MKRLHIHTRIYKISKAGHVHSPKSVPMNKSVKKRKPKHYSSEILLRGIERSSSKAGYEGYECFSSSAPVDAALQWVITIFWKVLFQGASTGGTLIIYQS